MKKGYLIFTILLIMVIGYAATQVRINIEGKTKLSENIGDFKVYLANLKLNGTEIEGINDTKDGYVINIPSKGTLEYDIVNESTEYDVEASVECEETNEQKTWTFDYTGGEQTFVAPASGTYKLETWGAQGGSYDDSYTGGYGGYSKGNIKLNKNEKIYLIIGGKGKGNGQHNSQSGGYNGGGTAPADKDDNTIQSSGGGATHISTKSGVLSALSSSINNILIVSGGGGGSAANIRIMPVKGGSGGGIKGNAGEKYVEGSWYAIGYGGTQTAGGSVYANRNLDSEYKSIGTFGTGASSVNVGGGGGFYGGGSITYSAGGGSGYIGNSLLSNKVMYCYNCEESSEEETKTISTTCVNETPTSNCAKIGNGYAKITSSSQRQTTQLTATTIEAQDKLNNKVEIENNGMKCNLKIKKLSRTEKKIYTGQTEWTFDYTGSEQTFTVPTSGVYKLETWGAQGGSISSYIGGYGGYSVGNIYLKNEEKIYLNVGGKGSNTIYGGYNGGGNLRNEQQAFGSSGGGTTHIATISGLLSTLENSKSNILIVSGGGGGANHRSQGYGDGNGGSGGGYIGNAGESINHTNGYGYTISTGGTQTSGGISSWVSATIVPDSGWLLDGQFGSAGTFSTPNGPQTGGGGGFYGGSSGNNCGGGGGSGYIGNSLLSNKVMYCYNCEESSEESTKTISTTCANETPTINCAKKGNGYARITLIK